MDPKNTEQAQDTTVAELPKQETETVELDTPITRGKAVVNEIMVRKPKSGALRGVSLTDVLQMDVTALSKVLPRITEPALTDGEIRDMDPADLVQLGGVVAGFLLPKKAREASE
ncbi:Phage tail assembly chaperone protein, E, or 41 or 14 [Onishia taeanensis]|uniref:Phage tail assembly chaperone protein, E, or 41 or 14 n=1 Tax=Onishia taeanensis TaxID=284577 RepID=A0A1G7SWP4_9GAMM|nr:phage tail assembly protein [Halomonas taeanensis]SDG27214.1 Phage tail assembly chaperone protein, E, or 41 or 14 [Halomonas taeanensis]